SAIHAHRGPRASRAGVPPVRRAGATGRPDAPSRTHTAPAPGPATHTWPPAVASPVGSPGTRNVADAGASGPPAAITAPVTATIATAAVATRSRVLRQGRGAASC